LPGELVQVVEHPRGVKPPVNQLVVQVNHS
jgi:hypothetical protein